MKKVDIRATVDIIRSANSYNLTWMVSPMEFGSDSKRRDDVPRGMITKYSWQSKLFTK